MRSAHQRHTASARWPDEDAFARSATGKEVLMLQIERFALDTVQRLAPVVAVVGSRDPDLARQMRRAASSILLNIAEAQSSFDGNSRQRLRSALGSARETRMALELATAWGFAKRDDSLVDAFDRITATLHKLSR